MRWRSDEALKTCTNRVVLALEDDYPATGKRAVFVSDIFNPCWEWKAANQQSTVQRALPGGFQGGQGALNDDGVVQAADG